jgi:hypothetical protein
LFPPSFCSQSFSKHPENRALAACRNFNEIPKLFSFEYSAVMLGAEGNKVEFGDFRVAG